MCLTISGAVLAAPESKAKPPSVVFMVCDDLGARDLGCYGSTFYEISCETSQIDRLAKDSIVFSDAYAVCPVCSPSRVGPASIRCFLP